MPNPRGGALPSELGFLIDILDDYERRLRLLESPSGEALSSTVAKLTALVANIQAQLDAWTASRYNNATIDAKDAAVQAQINPSIAAVLAGNVTIGGALYSTNAYGTDLTGTRRTAWWQSDGRAGYASSSRRKKTAIRPADEEQLVALLDVEPKSFRYRAEIAKRTARRINAGEDYVPAVELGLIAEELDDAGLGFFVYHNDETGEAEGVEYGMLTVALLAIARQQRDDLAEIHERLDRMEAKK